MNFKPSINSIPWISSKSPRYGQTGRNKIHTSFLAMHEPLNWPELNTCNICSNACTLRLCTMCLCIKMSIYGVKG